VNDNSIPLLNAIYIHGLVVLSDEQCFHSLLSHISATSFHTYHIRFFWLRLYITEIRDWRVVFLLQRRGCCLQLAGR